MKPKFHFADDEKQRIFSIALALMEDMGYEKLTIRKICEEADISIGKFYRFFDSKEQLLAFYYNEAEKAFREDIESKLQGLDIKTQLIQFYTWYTQYTSNFGVEFVIHFFNSNNPAMNTQIYNNEIINITDSLLEKAVQNGLKIPDSKSIREISCDLCVIVKGVIFDWCARHGEFSLSEYTNNLLTRCIRGIFTE